MRRSTLPFRLVPSRMEHEKSLGLLGNAVNAAVQQTKGVEAAGIEPASRDIFTKASTCVAQCLSFARLVATERATGRTMRERVLAASVLVMTGGDPELVTDF